MPHRDSALRQFARYLIVGASSVTLDLAALSLEVHLTGIHSGLPLTLLSSLSFLLAFANGYYWNSRWAFSAPSRVRGRFFRFACVNAFTLVLNDAIIYGLTSFHHPWVGISPVLHVDEAKVVAAVVTTAWNFGAFRYLVFSPIPRRSSDTVVHSQLRGRADLP